MKDTKRQILKIIMSLGYNKCREHMNFFLLNNVFKIISFILISIFI